ncbi:MAG: MFS transporter [Sphingomonadales bacterium]|nr:MFS transporter [Sphingomonadales bacterium]
MQSFGIMAESAKRELGLSDQSLAVIQGVGNAVPLVLFSVPIGVLVDRGRRVRLLWWLAVLWTAGTFATAVAGNAAVLFAGRMLVGIGTTGGLTAALSLSADLCPPHRRGRGMLIGNLGKIAGIAAGFALAGALLAWFDRPGAPHWLASSWRNAQATLGGLAALLVFPLLFLREPQRREVESNLHAPFRAVAAELWTRRGFLIPLYVGQTSVVMADSAASIWASPVLERIYHQAPGEFGTWLGAITLAAGAVGAVLGGVFADRGQRSGRRGGLLAGALAASVVGTPAALFPVMPGVAGFAVLIGLLILAGAVTGLIASVALTVLLPNEVRGLAIGAFIAVAGLVGFGVAPWLVAVVSTWLGGESMLAPALAVVGVATGLVSVAGFWLAMRHAPRQPIG